MRNERYHHYWTRSVPKTGTLVLDIGREDYVMNMGLIYTYNPATQKVVPKDAVVLDLDDCNIDGLVRVMRIESRARALPALGTIADQIEAQTLPAISEPMHIGAVVEDVDGVLWVRALRPGGSAPWLKSDQAGVNCWASWQSIHAVRVVPPEELVDS